MKRGTLLSKRNQRGMWVLVVVLCLIIITPRLLKAITPVDDWVISEIKLTEEMREMDQKIKLSKSKRIYRKKSKYKRPSKAFDPNQYTIDEWKALGLSAKQANVVVNFARRGIRSNSDLKQVFVISDELFDIIKDSTYYPIPDKLNSSKEKFEKANSTILVNVELNHSTKDQLMKLKGVGPYFADKIIEYREKLGGFHSKNQLLEIWNFDEEKLEEIKPFTTIDEKDLRKLNINTATVEELKSHPYITWNCANSIVKMRSKFQKYSNFDQLLESVLIDKELLNKIKPYLTL